MLFYGQSKVKTPRVVSFVLAALLMLLSSRYSAPAAQKRLVAGHVPPAIAKEKIAPLNHGNALSVYIEDPEGNRVGVHAPA